MTADSGVAAIKGVIYASRPFSVLQEREALDFEIDLFSGARTVPPELPPRPSYFRLESPDREQMLVAEGEFTTHFHLVLEGAVDAYHGRERLATHAAGEWFGEVSALSNLPAPCTYMTAQTTATRLAALDHRLFRRLYLDDEEFAQEIDREYRKISLALHLKSSPLFAELSVAELRPITDTAQLIRYPDAAGNFVLAAQDSAADAFYLVRSGGVKCTRRAGGRERILAYYMANSAFGEHCVATAASEWPGTYEALTATDLVKIPRTAFRQLSQSHPSIHESLTHAGNLFLDGESHLAGGPAARDEINVMVHRESVKGGTPLVIDQKRCIRCNACVEACISVHEDRVPRLSKVGTQTLTDEVFITACYHCTIPDCMAACNYGAIRRARHGTVEFVERNCVGCTACVEACPYDVIRMTLPETPFLPERELGSAGAWMRVPFLRGLLSRRRGSNEPERIPRSVLDLGGGEVRVRAKAIKCDRCGGLPFEACVYNCPTSAITRRTPEESFGRGAR